MLGIYYLVLFIAGLLVGPAIVLLKKKARAGIGQKLGNVPKGFASEFTDAIWIHAVSVGEFNAVWPLLSALHSKYPNQKFAISTTTQTGQEVAKQKAGSFAKVFYFPIDMPWATSAWLNALMPAAVMIVETEIWPGFYTQCRERGIPLIIVNGRISPRSYKRYQKLRALFSTILRQATLILAQSKQEAERYDDLTGGGVPITVTGNLKFDGIKAISGTEKEELQGRLNVSESDIVIVAGSTHEGEETALLRAHKSLRSSGVNSRLILVPRHPERFDRVAEAILAHGFRVKRFSKNESFESTDDVYLLDTIGKLMQFYSVADIAFVGGTIAPIGGHNLVEPCVYSVPVVCGPHVEKTRDVAQAMTEQNAIKHAKSEEELVQFMLQLAKDPGLRKIVGNNGFQWLNESQGAVQRALTRLEELPGLLDQDNSSINLAEATR